MRGVYYVVTWVYITEARLRWSTYDFSKFLELWIDFTKKNMLTEESIYLGMYGHL